MGKITTTAWPRMATLILWGIVGVVLAWRRKVRIAALCTFGHCLGWWLQIAQSRPWNWNVFLQRMNLYLVHAAYGSFRPVPPIGVCVCEKQAKKCMASKGANCAATSLSFFGFVGFFGCAKAWLECVCFFHDFVFFSYPLIWLFLTLRLCQFFCWHVALCMQSFIKIGGTLTNFRQLFRFGIFCCGANFSRSYLFDPDSNIIMKQLF